MTSVDLFYNYIPCYNLNRSVDGRCLIARKVMEDMDKQLQTILDAIAENELLICYATTCCCLDPSMNVVASVANLKEYLSAFRGELARCISAYENADECDVSQLSSAIEQASKILVCCAVDEGIEFFDASYLELLNECGDFNSIVDTATEFLEPIIEQLTGILHVIKDINTVCQYGHEGKERVEPKEAEAEVLPEFLKVKYVPEGVEKDIDTLRKIRGETMN